MVAAVEDEDLRPAGDGARDPQREAVGVGRGRGDLPEGQAEHPGKQVADGERILVGQHVGQAALGLTADRPGDGQRRMAEHGTGVAQAEVVEPVVVDIGDRGALRPLHDHRKGHGPVAHPVHGHAAEIAGRSLADRSLGAAAIAAIAFGLARPEIGDAAGVHLMPLLRASFCQCGPPESLRALCGLEGCNASPRLTLS